MKKSLYFILCFTLLNVLNAMDEEIVVTSSLGGGYEKIFVFYFMFRIFECASHNG